CFEWRQAWIFFVLFMLYGCFCYILGWTHIARAKETSLGAFFKIYGLCVMFLSLYIFSFDSLTRYLADEFSLVSSPDFWLLFIGGYSAAVALYIRYVSKCNYPLVKQGLIPEERALVPIFFICPLFFLGVFAFKHTGVVYAFLVNFSYICILITLLIAGYRRGQLSLKATAFIFLMLLVATRYIEVDMSLLHKALLFIITGVVILAFGIWIEKYKEKVVIIEE
ncbi:hypothetical protein ACFL2W_00540, partial [Candidatus Omnitrophota bacterium]